MAKSENLRKPYPAYSYCVEIFDKAVALFGYEYILKAISGGNGAARNEKAKTVGEMTLQSVNGNR